jgi:hypothetical protein
LPILSLAPIPQVPCDYRRPQTVFDPIFERKPRYRGGRLKASRHQTSLPCRAVSTTTLHRHHRQPEFTFRSNSTHRKLKLSTAISITGAAHISAPPASCVYAAIRRAALSAAFRSAPY